MTDSRKHVALIIETSRAYGRGLLEGIAAYCHRVGNWAITCPERSQNDPVPDWLDDWQGHGILARIESRELEDATRAKGVPVIELRGRFNTDFPLIETDDKETCRLAAEHLIERGFQHYAYCGYAGANYSLRRLKYFPPLLKAHGFDCHIYPPSTTNSHDVNLVDMPSEVELSGTLFEQELLDWVRELPKPIGIMACNDMRAHQLLSACKAAGLAVPEEVAILGVDDDQILCNLADPPLSSVQLDTWRIGWEAAQTLDDMMAGRQTSPAHKRFIPPRQVITRNTTDIIAIEDPIIAEALQRIRRNACNGMNVEDLSDALPISRRSLERRFMEQLGRSPKSEILRIRIERAKTLLLDTDFKQSRVARLAGFKHGEYLSVAFKRATGMNPSEFRKAKAVPDT